MHKTIIRIATGEAQSAFKLYVLAHRRLVANNLATRSILGIEDNRVEPGAQEISTKTHNYFCLIETVGRNSSLTITRFICQYQTAIAHGIVLYMATAGILS